MCSVGDDNVETETEKYMPGIEKLNLLTSAKCNKCRQNKPIVVLRNKDPYCRECFIPATTHKFKSLLGKSRLIYPNDRVLVYYEIGHPSTALLHFIRTGLDLDTPKKLRFEPVVLFIDDQLHLNVEERIQLLRSVKKQVDEFGFQLYFAPFVDFVLDNGNLSNLLSEDYLEVKDNGADLKSKLKTASKTNKGEIVDIWKRNLLIGSAKHLNCKFVFTPELSRNVAAQILINISTGRGPQIPLDAGFCDDRDAQVKILRPLKQFEVKELAFYNFLHNLDTIAIRQTHDSATNSVQCLIKKFVDNLQMEYPATVSTIVRTGDKLGQYSTDSERKCLLCEAKLGEHSKEELSSKEATRFSDWVSTQIQNNEKSRQDRYTSLVDSFSDGELSNYCFTCSKLIPSVE